jgi:hypothetical protein
MGSSQRGASGEKGISHREAGERHRTEDTGGIDTEVAEWESEDFVVSV